MPEKSFLRAIQRRTARVAVSASASRGSRGGGVVPAAREFAARLNLERFATSDVVAFRRALDSATDRLVLALPKRGGSWGLARKLLNIFLRDSLYVRYLNDAHRLDRAESLFEVPLDSITATRLRELDSSLPSWCGVKYLDPEASRVYQSVASVEAARRGIARVHLDAFWWGVRSLGR